MARSLMTHLGSWLRPLSALFARLNGTLPGIAIMGVEHGDASGNKTEQYLVFNNQVRTAEMYSLNGGKLST
jgi:hypothetical protein